MDPDQIKEAIEAGKIVCCRNDCYKVIKSRFGEFLIHCTLNNTYIGLFRWDGKMNEKESDFYIKE
jgi:hypothetical protein